MREVQSFAGSPEFGTILFLAFCGQAIAGVNYYYLSYFRNAEQAWNFTLYTIAVTLINFVAALFFVLSMKMGIYGIVYARVIADGTVLVVLNFKFFRMLSFSVNKTLFFEAFKLGYPLTPRVFLGVIGKQFDKYMIGLLVSVGG